MTTLSITVNVLFLIITAAAIALFVKAANSSKKTLFIISGWAMLQSMLAFVGFYKDLTAMPPRFIFLTGPAIICILILLLSKKGSSFVDELQLKSLTLLHVVRIPVEIVLYYLYIQKLVPSAMTFEGHNPDILSGISAMAIYYFCFVANKWSRKVLLVWNFICLLLLLNIVAIAVLSAQTPFQQMAFDQPNIGVTYFPFVLLPSVIVPLVLLSHLAAIRQLTGQVSVK